MTSSVKINLCKSNRIKRENYCRITRSPKHLFNYKHVFILSDIKPQHLFAWFCSYELPDPFFCMLTTIYGAFLHFLWIYCYTSVSLWTYSPSDLLFLVVSKTSWLATVVSLCRRCFCCCCRFSLCLSRNLRQLFTLWANLATSGQTIFVVW